MQLNFNKKLQPSNYKYITKINTFEKLGDQIFYTILIICNTDGSVKVSHKQYSELKVIHKRLQKLIEMIQLDVHLPEFPNSSLFSATNNSLEKISNRMAELTTYFQNLIQIEIIQDFPIINNLLPQQLQHDNLLESLLPTDFYDNLAQGEYSKEKCYEQMEDLKQQFLDKQDFRESYKTIHQNQSNYVSTNFQNFLFDFEGFGTLNGNIYYSVAIREFKKHARWKYVGRYSDFLNLHLALKAENLKVRLPEFPKKQIFTITNDNLTLLEARKQQLELYLNSLFLLPEVINSEIGIYFIKSTQRVSNKASKQIKTQVVEVSQDFHKLSLVAENHEEYYSETL